MADGPSKADIDAIFKRLRSSPANKQCFDCQANNPTWASVTYGVFLCIDCSAVHRSLGVHLTFIRSTQLDTSWTWMQLRAMQVGSNANAIAYFRQHGCTTTDAQQKYNSRAATMYRDKLRALANKAMQSYGTKLHVDSAHDEVASPSAHEKEVDFFKEHQEAKLSDSVPESEPIATNGTILRHIPVADIDPTSGPSVDAALSTSPTQAVLHAEPRKPTIGGRKPTGAKKAKGLGAKKGGLGAQKVKANFTELEQEAQARDRNREEEAATVAARTVQQEQDEEKKIVSMRLAYKDLSLESKRQEEKMKSMDPKKRAQMERLGMGMMGSGSGGMSHSLLNEMKTIEQEAPSNDRSERDRGDRYSSRNRDVDDDFEFIGGFSSGPPNANNTDNQYVDSPFGLKKEDRYSSWSNSNKSSSWDTVDRFDNKSSVIEDIPTAKDDDRGGRSRKAYEVSTTEDAQKKFGNAKGISSDQFFQKDNDFETRQSLSRFEGKSSISSADYFGNGSPGSGGSGGPSRHGHGQYGGAGPDLAEIREGVRQGVTKVAGKLSSLANGVMSSIQK